MKWKETTSHAIQLINAPWFVEPSSTRLVILKWTYCLARGLVKTCKQPARSTKSTTTTMQSIISKWLLRFTTLYLAHHAPQWFVQLLVYKRQEWHLTVDEKCRQGWNFSSLNDPSPWFDPEKSMTNRLNGRIGIMMHVIISSMSHHCRVQFQVQNCK